MGFLHVASGQWRLAPAFDLNPFPDKSRESKTWLTPDSGPIDSLTMLLKHASYFSLDAAQAAQIVAEVSGAVTAWRDLALSTDVGLTPAELHDFAPAFEHEASEAARRVAAGSKPA